MISVILATLFTSAFKALSYTRFFKLAVICLDLSFCLFAGFNLIGLTLSEGHLFGVPLAAQPVFIGSLLIRALIAGLLLFLFFEKPMPVSHQLDKYHGGAYLMTVLIYALSKFFVPAIPSVLQTISFDVGMAGLGYILVILTVKLTGLRALKIISF